MNDVFSTYHPIVNFIYFVAVIGFTMFLLHPVFLITSFITAFIYSVYLNRRKALKFNIIYLLPLLFISALINPLFNHQGITILCYFKNGNPLTLESVIYGIIMAFMFVSVILWFSCYNNIMSSDKFIYLFGRIIPGTSLILSMVLRFVPHYKAHIKSISNGQKCIGRDISQGKLLDKAKNGIKILSIMTTWALENAIETADSMKSRGYGLKGRTSFSNYKIDSRDIVGISIMAICILMIFIGIGLGITNANYYPAIKISDITPTSLMVYISYGLLCLLPILFNVIEEIKWKYIS